MVRGALNNPCGILDASQNPKLVHGTFDALQGTYCTVQRTVTNALGPSISCSVTLDTSRRLIKQVCARVQSYTSLVSTTIENSRASMLTDTKI